MTISPVSGSVAVEPILRTADIISFPARPQPVQSVPVPAAAEERLARALTSLSVAVHEQGATVAAWRNSLAELKATTIGLQDSLQRYQVKLRTLGVSVSSLQSKAQSLEAWADTTITD